MYMGDAQRYPRGRGRKHWPYVSAVGGQVGGTLRKGAREVWASLEPGLGFKHTAEHGQGLHIMEL